jgi:hypothetical protein
MRNALLPAFVAAALLPVLAVRAQAPGAAGAQPDPALVKACAALHADPATATGRDYAMLSQCVLTGAIPSQDRFGEARVLARKALALGEAGGGYMLYAIFSSDPANRYLRDGKVDMEKYRQLAQRTIEQRQDQVEAIEGLGVAAGKGSLPAGLLLATYFHETVAPGNVSRTRALAALLARSPDHPKILDDLQREAGAIEKTATTTKASVRTFLDAYQSALGAAQAGYKSQAGGKSCDRPTLKSVSSGALEDAQFLPLKGTLVAGSYLVKGSWSEFWTFDACGEEVPVVVKFQADGWGGATYAASYNKGE